MRRSWTDRDGVEWEVEVVGHISPSGPAIMDQDIQFLRVEDGERVRTEYPNWGPVNSLTNTELQRFLDEAREE